MTLPPPPPPSSPSTGGTTVACYRHPQREGGRRCTRCGKPACPDCLVQAAVGSHCLDCAKASRVDAKTRAKFWSAGQPALITMILIALNVLVFIATVVDNSRSISGSITQTHVDLLLNERFLSRDGQWYRLVTSGFLHYGIIHLAFNMYMLYLLGQMLEPGLGRVRFALAYFACLLGGSAGVLLLQPDGLTAGASGAVFGLLGLAAVGYYLRGVNPMSTMIGSLLIMNLVLTFLRRGEISVGGHLGGLVAGALCAVVMMAPANRGYPKWMTYATPIAVSALAVVICVVSVA